MHENLWVAIKWKFFSGKDNYFLPFQMPYSFLCCCKYPLRYVFLFEQRKFHQFWTRGKWVKLLTSLWTATLYPQNKSGRVRFLCWPTYIIWKGHVSLMWKLGAKRSWWQILSCKLAFNEFVIFICYGWLIVASKMLVFNSTGVLWGLMNSLLFLKCGLVSESLFFVCFIVTRAQYVNVQFSIHLVSGPA